MNDLSEFVANMSFAYVGIFTTILRFFFAITRYLDSVLTLKLILNNLKTDALTKFLKGPLQRSPIIKILDAVLCPITKFSL